MSTFKFKCIRKEETEQGITVQFNIGGYGPTVTGMQNATGMHGNLNFSNISAEEAAAFQPGKEYDLTLELATSLA